MIPNKTELANATEPTEIAQNASAPKFRYEKEKSVEVTEELDKEKKAETEEKLAPAKKRPAGPLPSTLIETKKRLLHQIEQLKSEHSREKEGVNSTAEA